ncbi:MAG TPA: hypothetical protein PLU16_00240 [Gallionellaceae bacterium]|nr:hypothetical protein [Gallionellaceae bacterium]HQS73602.1 hypothetical protein [Gallionellaceae bacterium]
MSTFYGIEESNTQALFEKDMVCVPLRPDGKLDLHNVVSPIKREDVVFVKHCTTQNILQIKAIGVVKSDYPAAEKSGFCMPVEWVWLGEKTLGHFDELLSVRSDMIYEEHDILVQKEINNLLPEKYQLQQEW